MWDWLVKHHRHVIVVLILVISFQLAYSDLFSKGPFVYPSKVIYQSGTLLMSGIAEISCGIKKLWQNYIALVNVKKENIELKKQVGILNLELEQLKDIEIKYHNILNILNLPLPYNNLSYVTAIVIGKDISSIFRTVSVNKGTADGIKKGDGVISMSGVVGRVVKVSPHASQVLLLTDTNSFIEGVDKQTRIRGIINGTGFNRLNFLYVLSDAPINNGDTIVTGGQDGIFPEGINIGKVVSISNKSPGWLFKDVVVQPDANIDRLYYVMILTGEKQ
jgi:rod shape-determining protein MreC